MSANALLISCPEIQDELRRVWDGITPLNVADPKPFYEYLLSPSNTNGIQQMVVPGKGKVRTVNLTYSQRLLESTVTSQTGRDCTASGAHEMKECTFTIDTQDVLKSSEQVNVSDLADLCQDNNDYLLERLLFHMDVVDRKAATVISGQAAALAGNYSADAVAAYDFNGDKLEVTTKTSGAFNPLAWEEINGARMMSGLSSFIGFGGQLVDQAARNAVAGCCSSVGLDLGELYNLYGTAYGYDRRLATALGSVLTESLFMEEGALQLLHYTEYPAFDGLIDIGRPYNRFNAVTPSGLPVDVFVKDDCGVLNIAVYANVKLVSKCQDMFAVGDNFAGVNGVGLVTVANT